MLNTPLFVLLRERTLPISHLRIDITTKFYYKLYHTQYLLFEFAELIKSFLFSLKFKTSWLEFGLFLILQKQNMFFDRFPIIFSSIFRKRFDKKQQKVKTMIINLLNINLQLILITLLQFFLNKLQLLQPPTS